jgi:hypothetical protein
MKKIILFCAVTLLAGCGFQAASNNTPSVQTGTGTTTPVTPVAPPASPGSGTASGPQTIVFMIPAGTGQSGAWNTAAAGSIVTANQGDTLTIMNNDTVAHETHTSNSQPYAHPSSSIAPGKSASFVLVNPHDDVNDPPVYDHIFGNPSARFHIQVNAAPSH